MAVDVPGSTSKDTPSRAILPTSYLKVRFETVTRPLMVDTGSASGPSTTSGLVLNYDGSIRFLLSKKKDREPTSSSIRSASTRLFCTWL
jgi:hypothetical protein